METRQILIKSSGASTAASLFGILAGLGGLTHGIGELLQGNTAPGGIIINSWTQGPIATNMGGEPAMTIVPNLFLTGALTILVSLATILWSAVFVQGKNGGRVLIGLSVLMLLVGGGFGPPIIGILAGVAGTGIYPSRDGWRTRLLGDNGRFVLVMWPLMFAIAAISSIFLVIGSLILVYFFGLDNDQLFLNTFYLTVLALFLTVVMTPAYDFHHGGRAILV
jgi:hypothetical protein